MEVTANMVDIFEKCSGFTAARQLIEAGIYPYFKQMESVQAPEVKVGGKMMIMMGSNNYLGLADDPRMKKAAEDALEHYGTGCAGSRLLNGNTTLHVQLEEKLARFKRKEAALVYATGYQMNLGVVSCLIGKGDIAIVDKLDHASILDGCKLSNGEIRRFRHNDMDDLNKVLTAAGPDRGKIVIVDGVFSMEGDICPLPDIVALAKRHHARIMVDDAHSTGVLGQSGRGTCEHFGIPDDDVDLVVGTCSKSFASVGGFVVGKKDVIHFIQHTSRSMIFSAGMPPASVATISKAIDISESEPERRIKLWSNTAKLKEGLRKLGYDTGISQTPIVPIHIGDDFKTFLMWKTLYELGIFTNPVVSPAVPPGRSMIRMTTMATHTDAQIDRVLNVFENAAKKLGITPVAPAPSLQ